MIFIFDEPYMGENCHFLASVYPIKSKNDFYKPFGSNKKSMKAYARQSGVNRMNLEYFIIFLAEYYGVHEKENQG